MPYTSEHGDIWIDSTKKHFQFNVDGTNYSIPTNQWYTSGEAITKGKFVSIADEVWKPGNAGKIYKTDSASVDKTVGIAINTTTASGQKIEVISFGMYEWDSDIFLDADIGKTAYIAPGASDGDMSTDRTQAVSSGNQLIECGIVASRRKLFIDFEGDSRGALNLSQLEYTAGEAITTNNAPKVVCQDTTTGKVLLADRRKSQNRYRVAGILVGASSGYATTIALNTSVVVQRLGLYEDASFNFTPGLPVFLDINGTLTQNTATLSYYTDTLVRVGVARSATGVYVQVGDFIEHNDYNKLGSIIAQPPTGPDYGWLTCDGSAVSRTTYADLFAIVGTTFGAGDGSTTFNLPPTTSPTMQIKYNEWYLANPPQAPLFRYDTGWSVYSSATETRDINISTFGYDPPLEDIFVEIYAYSGSTYRKIEQTPVIYTLVGTPSTYTKYGYQITKTTANTIQIQFANNGLAYFDRTSGNYVSINGWNYKVLVYKTERYNKFFDYTADQKLRRLWEMDFSDYDQEKTVQVTGKFDRGITNPAHTTRLNYDGELYTYRSHIIDALVVDGNVTLGNAGTDAITIKGDLAVKADDGTTSKFTVDNATGNTLISGTLGVTGAFTLSSNLTITTDLAVNGGDISSSASTFNFLQTGVSTINIGTTATTGASSVNIGRASDSTVSIGNLLSVAGGTNIAGDLAVNGGDITTTSTTFNITTLLPLQ